MRKSELDLLLTLANLKKPDTLSHLIPFLNDRALEILCEAGTNVLFREFGLSLSPSKQKQIKKLACKHAKTYKHLSRKKLEQKKRRRFLKQTGSGLGFILSLAAPLIASLFGK